MDFFFPQKGWTKKHLENQWWKMNTPKQPINAMQFKPVPTDKLKGGLSEYSSVQTLDKV